MAWLRNKTPDKTLVIPPKKWHGTASLRGYAGQLRTLIESADRVSAMSGERIHRRIVLEPETAKALLEIVCQAIHTEQAAGL